MPIKKKASGKKAVPKKVSVKKRVQKALLAPVKEPKNYQTKYVVLGLLIFVFLAWLLLAFRSLYPSQKNKNQFFNQSQAGILDPSCNGDPLITVLECQAN